MLEFDKKLKTVTQDHWSVNDTCSELAVILEGEPSDSNRYDNNEVLNAKQF